MFPGKIIRRDIMTSPTDVGFSLKFEAEKKKLDKLNQQYASLLAAYDELVSTVRANLEADYMMRIGRKEHQVFSLQIQVQQLKREISLYQAARNQGETVSSEAVQKIIEQEFAEYKAQLAEQQEKIRQAENLHLAEKLPAGDAKALKELYHDMVRKLHPDLNPGLPEKAKILWQKISEAYKSWDWQELNVLADMAYDLLDRKEIKIEQLNSMETILERQKNVSEKIEAVRAKTEELRNRPPFTYEKMLSDQEAVNARRKELDELKVQFEEHIRQLTAVRNELRGGK